VAVDDAGCRGPRFRRGDCDGDGLVTFVDPILLLFANFAGASVPCLAACDSNGDGSTSGVSDVIYLLRHLYLSGPAPAAPYPGCGNLALPADDALGCETPPEACLY
jgi:hypothetical protein